MTDEEAKELAIEKWESIVANHGYDDEGDSYTITEEMEETGDDCAYCFLYDRTGGLYNEHRCIKCPIFIEPKEFIDGWSNFEFSCAQDGHPWNIWFEHGQTQAQAQAVLQLIKDN